MATYLKFSPPDTEPLLLAVVDRALEDRIVTLMVTDDDLFNDLY